LSSNKLKFYAPLVLTPFANDPFGYYHEFVLFVVSINEKEELADLRQRCKKLERQNANLQKEVDQLLKFKKNCLANHHNIKTEKVQKSESNDPYRHDGTIVLL
jgi:lipid II:glycine glycyltransferase (peptidoglycan interpeptide bridge formation enzyme)